MVEARWWVGFIPIAREDDRQQQGILGRIVIEEYKENNAFYANKKLKENNLVPSLKKNMEEIVKKEEKLYKKENLSYKENC